MGIIRQRHLEPLMSLGNIIWYHLYFHAIVLISLYLLSWLSLVFAATELFTPIKIIGSYLVLLVLCSKQLIKSIFNILIMVFKILNILFFRLLNQFLRLVKTDKVNKLIVSIILFVYPTIIFHK